MTEKGKRLPAAVFVLLGLIALVFLALKASHFASLSVERTYTIRACFANIGALRNGASVRSAGVSVGQVKLITLDKKTLQGLVIMKINQDIHFPSDSSAKIFTAGLLGEQYIDIEPGIDDKMMANDDLIERTQSAIVLENLLGQLSSANTADASPSERPASGALDGSAPLGVPKSGSLR